MSQFTPNLLLPILVSGGGDNIATHKRALMLLDGLVQPVVVDRSLSSPPAPASGDMYIVKATGSGAWLSHSNHLAYWTGTKWEFLVPESGWQVYLQAEKTMATWDGSKWATRTGDAFFSAVRTSTLSVGNVGTRANLGWTNQITDISTSQLYTHSTSSNSHQITLQEAGDYLVEVDVTFEAITSGTNWNRTDLALQVAGSDVAQGLSFGYVNFASIKRVTVHAVRMITVTAGQILSVQVERGAGTNAEGLQVLEARIAVRKA